MTDLTISDQAQSCNQEDRREADRAARAASYARLGYQWNPGTGTWQLKPKELRPPSTSPGKSRQYLCLPDEDYSNCVCLLLPKGHATLIDVWLFEYACRFDWLVMGRTIFYVETSPVTYVRRRCGIGKTGYGKFRIPPSQVMHQMSRVLFLAGIEDEIARWNAGIAMHRKEIDHRNRNPWDNRCQNLRPATKSENGHNKAPAKNKSSKYKGVTKIKGKERWMAHITVRGKTLYLGTFDDEFKAAQKYNAAVRKFCPEFGYINPLSC